MKLPKNYSTEAGGVVKATAYGGVGQKLMESMGWSKGQGLGKDKAGMREALEVKEKKDTLGVGATGSWDWTQKFWENAYNSIAANINHGDAGSDSSSSDSSSSEDESTKPTHRKGKQNKVKSSAAAGKKRATADSSEGSDATQTPAHSDPSSDSSSSDSDAQSSGHAHKKQKRSSTPVMVNGVLQHRDGTLAAGATAEELAIAAALSKDPWGRWGGKAGKMARIRQQEEEAAAAARARLGLSPTPPPAGKAAAGKPGKAGAGQEKQELQANGEAGGKQRIVVTLTIKEDTSFKREPFKPTPATGWWGAGYFVSAGALEGMEEAAEHVSRKRTTFNEDDQAALYMQAHNAKREGHRGLGKSEKLTVAGGWQGKKQSFGDDDEGGSEKQGGQTAAADTVGKEGSPEPAQQQQEEAKSSKKKKGSKSDKSGKKKSKRNASDEGPGSEEGEGREEQGSEGRESAVAEAEAHAEAAAQAAADGRASTIKWLKVVKSMLKQAPNSRLKVKKLCRQLLEHVRERHGPGATLSVVAPAKDRSESSREGSPRLKSHHIQELLEKKAKKGVKLVIQKGYVALPTN